MDLNPVNINHINDVLPHIKDKPEIILINKEGYSVLDYVYSSKDTFDNAFARECRGIKFDSTGKIIARPYHKFHNVGENEEYSTQNINLSNDHHKLDKLDGSMCHSCLVDGTWRLMTRKGESEVALKAMAFLKSDREFGKRYYDLFEAMRSYTPIFEYVGPDNRIVIPYKKEELILTGIRHITSGHYTSYDIMAGIATAYGIPYVGVYDRIDVNSDTEKEGCIIRFASGAMAKMKSEIYVRKHRSKDLVTNFKDLVKLIMDDDLDDVLPQLDEETKVRVLQYKDELMSKVNMWADDVSAVLDETKNLTQKEFALQITSNDLPALRPALFNARKTGDSFEEVKRCIIKAYGDTTRLETLFEELQLPKFVGDFFSEKNDKSN